MKPGERGDGRASKGNGPYRVEKGRAQIASVPWVPSEAQVVYPSSWRPSCHLIPTFA